MQENGEWLCLWHLAFFVLFLFVCTLYDAGFVFNTVLMRIGANRVLSIVYWVLRISNWLRGLVVFCLFSVSVSCICIQLSVRYCFLLRRFSSMQSKCIARDFQLYTSLRLSNEESAE